MYEIYMTEEYQSWQKKLKGRTKTAVLDNVKQLSEGNFNNTRQVGGDIYEKKIYTGAGYRIYYFLKKQLKLILLHGGDKRTQQSDIKKAIKIRKEIDD